MATITQCLPHAYRVADVATALDAHPQTVYTLIREGRLRAVRIGRSLRVTDAALREFLAGS